MRLIRASGRYCGKRRLDLNSDGCWSRRKIATYIEKKDEYSRLCSPVLSSLMYFVPLSRSRLATILIRSYLPGRCESVVATVSTEICTHLADDERSRRFEFLASSFSC